MCVRFLYLHFDWVCVFLVYFLACVFDVYQSRCSCVIIRYEFVTIHCFVCSLFRRLPLRLTEHTPHPPSRSKRVPLYIGHYLRQSPRLVAVRAALQTDRAIGAVTSVAYQLCARDHLKSNLGSDGGHEPLGWRIDPRISGLFGCCDGCTEFADTVFMCDLLLWRL